MPLRLRSDAATSRLKGCIKQAVEQKPMLVQARCSGVDEKNRGVQAGASPKLQGGLKPMRPEEAGSLIRGRSGPIAQEETVLTLLGGAATKVPADQLCIAKSKQAFSSLINFCPDLCLYPCFADAEACLPSTVEGKILDREKRQGKDIEDLYLEPR